MRWPRELSPPLFAQYRDKELAVAGGLSALSLVVIQVALAAREDSVVAYRTNSLSRTAQV